MQEEIEHKTVNLAISTTKLSARTLLRGMQFLLRQYDKHASQGKQSMKRLVRQNRGVTNVEIQKTGMIYTQLFNLLCDKADDQYGGKLPVHVRCLIDECANIGQIPQLEKLVATIRSREISACLVLQTRSQLKAIYKDNADTIVGNMDSQIFLGGSEPTTLKELSEALGKETISNTFDIIMAVFDVTQQVVANSSGIISGNTRVNDIGLSMLQSSMMQMDVGPLFGLFLQSFFIGITMRILSIVIFVIVYGRMIEIYMMVSLAPVPMATWGNHEQSHVGQNYLRSLFALGFQGFLILICVAIYAVLLQNVAISGDAINSIWSIVGYTVLLCFSLFKTSSVAKTLLGAH